MNKRFSRKKESGSYLVLGAGLIAVMTGFAVLAIDVGRILYIRNELQNVADAAALAGANCLNRQSMAGSTTDCTVATSATLNWNRASVKATFQLGRNSADNFAISTTDLGHTVETGYWNLLTGAPSGGTLSNTFSPITANDKPAVRVTVTKDAGMNNGPIRMLTAAMFGGSDVPMTAQAVAVLSSPGMVLPSNVIPQVVNKCMYDKYWDSSTGEPVKYKAGDINPFPEISQKVGEAWELLIGSSYHYGTCASGQWTSFLVPDESSKNIENLIKTGNTSPIKIGDDVYVTNGSMTSNYKDILTKYPSIKSGNGVDVALVVVDDLAPGELSSVIGFAGFHITAVDDKNGKYIQGHFIKNYIATGSGGIGPFFGTYTPPRLAQ